MVDDTRDACTGNSLLEIPVVRTRMLLLVVLFLRGAVAVAHDAGGVRSPSESMRRCHLCCKSR